MLEDRIVFLDGDFIAWNHATVHVMSHSFSRASAIYEILSLNESSLGPSVFRLDEHIDRLFKSAELLHMELPIPPPRLREVVLDTVRRNSLSEGIIKITAFYPQIAIDILPPTGKLSVCVIALDPHEGLAGSGSSLDHGTTICISRWRKLAPETVPIEAKVTANYLNGMLARLEAVKRGFEYVIMLDTSGFISEGATESVFLVKDGRLMTPSLGTVLESITRKSVLQIAAHLGIETVEEQLLPGFLYEAEELFLSSTTFKVHPVRQIESRVLENTPGPVTSKVSTTMDQIVAGQEKRFKKWLFPVG